MQELNHSFTSCSIQVRRAIEPHRDWIEDRIGVLLSEAVVFETDLPFHEAAIPRLIGCIDYCTRLTSSVGHIAERLQSVEVPPSHMPIIEVARAHEVTFDRRGFADGANDTHAYSLEWGDGPILLRLRDVNFPIVAFCVGYHPGPDSIVELYKNVALIPRRAAGQFLSLMNILTISDGKAKLKVDEDTVTNVTHCEWDQLVLDQGIVSLLKNDFESFFEREAWFRKMRLPFRRGYLLHGPPGNGKSTAIRAMLTSRGLTGYTTRFFDPNIDDGDLDRTFLRAAQSAPAMVLLEDIDRAFPRAANNKTNISLQQLLNCLDGVNSGEGIITVATANEPTVLDPAILKRPGRFDRVVHFPNPSSDLRRDYFSKMHPSFAGEILEDAVAKSDGFSFAQLREAYIMAGQSAFIEDREIAIQDLLHGVLLLRRSVQFGSIKGASVGFAVPAA